MNGVEHVAVADPWYGDSTLAYDAFRNNYQARVSGTSAARPKSAGTRHPSGRAGRRLLGDTLFTP